MTLRDGTGTTLVTVALSWNATTGTFNNPAVHVVNSAGHAVPVVAVDSGQTAHTFSIPAGTTDISPAQLALVGIVDQSHLQGVALSLA